MRKYLSLENFQTIIIKKSGASSLEFVLSTAKFAIQIQKELHTVEFEFCIGNLSLNHRLN